MSLRLSLKWAIILVVILGMILMVPPLLQGNYSKAGGAFAQWAIISIIIILIGTWDEYTAKKK
ncbi:MAG: hypothetical protein WC593_00700 [Methanoregula sp.]